MGKEKCLFCDSDANSCQYSTSDKTLTYECPNCKKYSVTLGFQQNDVNKLSRQQRSLVSGYLREMNELSKNVVTIDSITIEDILISPYLSRTFRERTDKLLLYMYRRSSNFGVTLYPKKASLSICYAANAVEYNEAFNSLLAHDYIKEQSEDRYKLTSLGIQRAQEIERMKTTTPKDGNVFVAMWFSDEMKSVYEEALKPAIQSPQCGLFKAFRVDDFEHNNDITDEIINGINACSFMVADLTGCRGGVYYEAGFARGLGKPVIFTCRKDWYDGEISPYGKILKERVHFDINHQNIIVWRDIAELKTRVINRIKATI